jgi:Double-stranded DNA deaminase toxin A
VARIEEVAQQLHAAAERATTHWLLIAGQEIEPALSGLSFTLAASSNPDAQAVAEELPLALQRVNEARDAVVAATAVLAEMIRKLTGGGTGALVASAPVAAAAHPTLRQAPPADQRDQQWANQVRRQLAEWKTGGKTEGMIFDPESGDWKLRSGTDDLEQLTAEAEQRIQEAINNGDVGTCKDPRLVMHEQNKLREARTHVETKAAVWARRNGKRTVDVVTNRKYVCGEGYSPGTFDRPPGCYQAVAAILPKGSTMRVWVIGRQSPIIIEGKAWDGDAGRVHRADGREVSP